jgi:outer membrane immunogenic protein
MMIAAPAIAQDDAFNWSGLYFGGGIGVVQSRGSDEIVYDDDSFISDWQSGAGGFLGDIYDLVNQAGIGTRSLRTSSRYDLDLEAIEDWINQASTSETQAFGTVFAGAQWQAPDTRLVVGGEVRANFGSFGSSHSESGSTIYSDDGAATCGASACVVTSFLPALLALGWDLDVQGGNVTLSLLGRDESATISGSVAQETALSFSTAWDRSFSALAKIGVPVDRALIYAIAGPTVANVTASASASVVEDGEIVLGNGNRSATYSKTQSYEWSGSTSENRVGFTFGAGVDYAATDNIILRGEVSYTNLGKISVTGTSPDTDAFFTVNQQVGAAQALASVMFKF